MDLDTNSGWRYWFNTEIETTQALANELIMAYWLETDSPFFFDDKASSYIHDSTELR